jgi:hypothetical protein
VSDAPLFLEASRLRADFDRVFAEAEPPPSNPGESLLAVEVAGDPYALRLGDLAFLERGASPAFLATGAPSFLGLAGLRGEVLPVWDLAGLLGYPVRPLGQLWMACSADTPRWAAAFGRFGGLLHASDTELEPNPGGGPALVSRFARGICRASGVCRPVLDLRLISQAIREGSKR